MTRTRRPRTVESDEAPRASVEALRERIATMKREGTDPPVLAAAVAELRAAIAAELDRPAEPAAANASESRGDDA